MFNFIHNFGLGIISAFIAFTGAFTNSNSTTTISTQAKVQVTSTTTSSKVIIENNYKKPSFLINKKDPGVLIENTPTASNTQSKNDVINTPIKNITSSKPSVLILNHSYSDIVINKVTPDFINELNVDLEKIQQFTVYGSNLKKINDVSSPTYIYARSLSGYLKIKADSISDDGTTLTFTIFPNNRIIPDIQTDNAGNKTKYYTFTINIEGQGSRAISPIQSVDFSIPII